VHSIYLLGIAGILIFSLSFLIFISQAKLQFQSTCIKESLLLQKSIIQAEKKLFSLNPLSSILSYRMKVAQLQLTAATLAMNFPAIASATAEIARIRQQQIKLDQIQRSLIFMTNSRIAVENLRIQSQINQATSSLSNRWNFFIQTFLIIRSDRISKMAVQARTSGLAPNYELKPNYKVEQAVAFNWQLRYLTRNDSQRFLKSSNRLKLSCGVLPNRNGEIWSAEIQKDKFY